MIRLESIDWKGSSISIANCDGEPSLRRIYLTLDTPASLLASRNFLAKLISLLLIIESFIDILLAFH